MDFDAIHTIDLERHLRQGSRGFGGIPLVDLVDVNLISNFSRVLANPRMKASSSQDLGFVPVEDGVYVVLICMLNKARN